MLLRFIEALAPLIVYLVVFGLAAFVVIMIGRNITLWYFRINEAIKISEQQLDTLRSIEQHLFILKNSTITADWKQIVASERQRVNHE